MRVVTVLGAASALALAVSWVVAAGPAQAAGPTVDGVTVAKPAISVSGIGMSGQTITAHIVDPTADPVLPPAPPGHTVDAYWMFRLTGTGGNGTLRAIDVLPVLTSGTLADGRWSAVVNIPSTADGRWTLSSVTQETGGTQPNYAVTGAPTFTVTGTHQPRLSFTVVPDPLKYPGTSGVVTGRVVDADTRLGMPGLTVGYSRDTNCVQFPPDAPIAFLVTKRTSATGGFRFTPSDLRQLNCLGLVGTIRTNSDGYSMFPVFTTFSVPVRPIVTATPMATSGRVGTPVRVRGAVYGRARTGTIVVVQQLHGRTAWRTVVFAAVSSTGYYTAWPAPTVRGPNVYRTVSPEQDGMAYSLSRPFTIRGT